jgi:hypothetical protein
MTDVLRGPGSNRSSATGSQIWISDYARGHYTEVARAWVEARERGEFRVSDADPETLEAIGWSLALTKSWDAYASFRSDLLTWTSATPGAGPTSPLLSVLDGWRAIHEARYDACLHAVRGARDVLLAPGAELRVLAHALKVEGVALFRMGRYVDAESTTPRALDVIELAGDALKLSQLSIKHI